MTLNILKKILDFLKTKESVKYLTLVLSCGGIAGFFVYNLLTQYNVITESSTTLLISVFLFSAIYIFIWILSSYAISRFYQLDLHEVLPRDAFTYLPSILFLFYGIRFKFVTLGSYAAVNVAADATNVLGKFLILLVVSSTLSLKVLFFGFDKKYEKNLESRLDKVSDKMVYSLIGIFVIVFSILAILKFNSFQTARDLGTYDQLMWNLLHGRFFESSLQYGISLRGPVVTTSKTMVFHFEPIFLLLIPFYILYQSPITLMVLQIFLIGLGVLPVYWLSRELLDNKAAAIIFSIAYLLFPALNYTALYDFHPIALVTPLLLFAFYYIQRDDYTKVSLLLILALMCKENVTFVVVMLGGYIFTVKKRRKIGALIALLGLVWFYLSFFVIIAHFAEGASYYYLGRYNLGNNFTDVIKTIILHPIFVLKLVLTPEKMGYLALLFAPLGFISLLDPIHLLIAGPIFAQNLLPTHAFQYSIYASYNSQIIPFLFISAIYGVKRFSGKKNVFYAILLFILVNSLLANFFFSPSPLNFFSPFPLSSRGFRLDEYTISPHDNVANRIIKLIPDDASVSTEQKFSAHLNHREELFLFPINIDKVDYVLLDTYEPKLPITQEFQYEHIQKFLESGDYSIVAEEDGIILLKKG